MSNLSTMAKLATLILFSLATLSLANDQVSPPSTSYDLESASNTTVSNYNGNNTSNSNNSDNSPTVNPEAATLTATNTSEPDNCVARNSSCEFCVKSKKCVYCHSTGKCLNFSYRLEACPTTKDTAYGTCLVTFNTLVIVLGSIGGLLLLTVLITCCWCCSCRRKRSGWYDSQKEAWSMRGSVIRDNPAVIARKEERQRRVEEIKRKYGIPEKKYARF